MKTIKTYTIKLLFVVAVCLQSCLSVNEENFCLVTTLDAVITEEGITFKGKIDKKAFDETGFVLQLDGIDEIQMEVEDFHGGMMEITLPFVYEYEDYWGKKSQINFRGQSIKYSAFVSDDWDTECGVRKELFVPIITSMDYVDLGLSVKWATCNVGAAKPEEFGIYFAWGETTTKGSYYWGTYKFMDSNVDSWTGINKYTFADGQTIGVWYDSEGNFIGDNKTVLDPEDDAASVNMGGSWRMPTVEELQELIDECTWTWTTLNGVNGYNVEGPNGNSIFLPAAGYRYNSTLNDAGSDGHYWSSSLSTSSSNYAYFLRFNSDGVNWCYGYDRCIGLSVRGVFK